MTGCASVCSYSLLELPLEKTGTFSNGSQTTSLFIYVDMSLRAQGRLPDVVFMGKIVKIGLSELR